MIKSETTVVRDATGTEIRTTRRATRMTAKCPRKGCKSVHSMLVIRIIRSSLAPWRDGYPMPKTHRTERLEWLDGAPLGDPPELYCAEHRARMYYIAVKGTFKADVKCNAKCVGSKGHVCECACGGQNHGAGHG